jgi:arylsulfatase
MRNILLITFDSLRADHTGFMGYERDTTPTIDKMAQEGVTYENAVSVAPRTNMSMTSVMTGEPQIARSQVSLNPEYSRKHLRRHGTIASELSEQGYSTAAFCPNAHASRYYGYDQGFDYFQDFLFDNDLYQKVFDRHTAGHEIFTHLRNLRNFIRREEAFKTWDRYVDELVDWVENQREPFFVWAFSLDTHFPHLVPRKYRQWSNLFDIYYYNWVRNSFINEFDVDLTPRQYQKLIDIYDDSVFFADQFVRVLRERLSEYDPIFVLHADHGEAFNEHGIVGHFYPQLYEELTHVPFLVYNTDAEATNVTKPVSLAQTRDVVRRSLKEPETLRDVGKDWVVLTDYDGRRDRKLVSVRTEDWKYHRTISDSSIEHELYNLQEDPTEQENLVGDELPVESELQKIATRRLNHEKEQLTIREGLSEISTGTK